MKQLYFLVILIFINCNKQRYDNNGYIEFVHIGIVNHLYNPLYISTKKIDIHLNKSQISDLQQIIGKNIKITPQKVKEYIKAKFDIIVTDKKTYLSLSEFIFSNKDFYINDEHQNDNPDAESYNIHIDKIKFSIYYKLKNKYFESLKTYLNRRKCDRKVIEALSHL